MDWHDYLDDFNLMLSKIDSIHKCMHRLNRIQKRAWRQKETDILDIILIGTNDEAHTYTKELYELVMGFEDLVREYHPYAVKWGTDNDTD